MTGKYASQTEVSADRSKAEIEHNLQKYGATRFATGWDDEEAKAVVSFEVSGRRFRFVLALPWRDDRSFHVTPVARVQRSEAAARSQYEKAVRQRWRALALVIKAKLVAVDEGLLSFEDEFLAYTVLPDGSTVGDWAGEQIDMAYASNVMPPLLPGIRAALPDAQRQP